MENLREYWLGDSEKIAEEEARQREKEEKAEEEVFDNMANLPKTRRA